MISKSKKHKDIINYSQDDKREPSNKYAYQQWLAYTYFGYKESKPQKLTLKKSEAKSEIYDGSQLLASYEQDGNVFWLGTPALNYEIFGRAKDIRKSKKEEFAKVDESYFKVEELQEQERELTQEEKDKIYLNQRGKMKAKIIKYLEEGALGGSETLRVRVDDTTKQMTAEEIAQWVLDNFKNAFNKYGLTLTGWLIAGAFESVKEKNRLVLVLNQLIEQDDEDYNEEFNGLSIKQLKDKYAAAVKAAIRKEKEAINNMPVQNNGYTVVRIRDEAHAKSYKKYLDIPNNGAWCITGGMWNSYIDPEAGKAEVFYFLLKDGYKDYTSAPTENASAKDEFGLSMIAVSVRQDGTIRTATPRRNHGYGGGEGIFTDLELSQIIGKSIYKACPPLSSPLDLSRDVNMKGINYLNSKQGDRKLNFYGGFLYLLEGKELVTDTWDSILKFNRVISVRNDKMDPKSEIIGYILIQKVLASEAETDTTNDASIDFYYGLDLNLNLVYGPSNKGNIYSVLPKVRKILKGE